MRTNLQVYIDGQRLRIDPRAAIGKGGEADVYDIGDGKVLKLYKPPDHPDYALDPLAQQAAHERLQEHQRKLGCIPPSLPAQVVAPDRLATGDRVGTQIVGYTMRYLQSAEVLLRYADRAFREMGGIPNQDVVDLFRRLHRLVEEVHRAGVVIGDFNDLNVLVQGRREVYLIDIDSAQFGPFLCRAFTARFVDPLLCDPQASELTLARPHTADSDWYAFTIMLMQCLLYVAPYGGLYKPADPARRIPHHLRLLRRISVFHPEVGYPKPAIPYRVLPDELLQHFQQVFEKDVRGTFPLRLLDNLRWTTCPACKTEHARPTCPICFQTTPAAVRQMTVVRGTVTATRLFRTTGTILAAEVQNGALRYLYHENGKFRRENGDVILTGDLDPALSCRLHGAATLIGRLEQVVVFHPEEAPQRIGVDRVGTQPAFDANEGGIYWTQAGQLWRSGRFGPEYLGDVLARQTHLRVGPTFGFGFYRAGEIQVAFVFDAQRRGINDAVKLPPLPGQLIDYHCAFTDRRCWFLYAAQDGGKVVHRCYVIRPDGSVEAQAEAGQGDGSWLGATIRGGCAVGSLLLTPTDEGIVRVEIDQGRLALTKTFPDTEPFVNAACRLLPGPNGLYVVNHQEIQLLKIT